MTKSTLLKLYSIVKVVRAKELPLLSKVYKDSPERLLVMFKKRPETPRITLNDLMKEIKSINTRIDNLDKRLTTRLDKHEQLFKQHGWIK